MSQTTIRKAVLPVAGLGSRFLPATKAVPKELLPIVDRPILDYALEEARAAGIEEFVFVTARGKDSIVDYLDARPDLVRQLEESGKPDLADRVRATSLPPGRATFVRQDEPLGLGHAVWCARNAVGDEPFAVILPDDVILGPIPCLATLLAVRERHGGHVAAVVEVPREQTRRYGILDVDGDTGRVARARGLVEKPEPRTAPSTLAIIGRYVLGPEVFAELERHDRGAGGEIQLTDAIARRIGREPFHGARFDGLRFDCGSKEGYLEAVIAFALARRDLSGAMARMLSTYAVAQPPARQDVKGAA